MADEPERRIVGVILAELERQVKDGNMSHVSEFPDPMGTIAVEGTLDLYLLARSILKEVEPPKPPKPPRFIEFDLPVRQTADLLDESTIWEVPMKPRNLPSADSVTVKVIASSAEEALSKALSAKPGHSWGKAVDTGVKPLGLER